MGVAIILTLAAALALIPARVDCWALARGASPQTLAVLAAVTLAGVATVPITLAVCTGFLAAAGHSPYGIDLLALAGSLLTAVAAGRVVARMLAIRRHWTHLARVTAATALPEQGGGVKVLPSGKLLAFVAGTDAFISQGLIDRLTPQQRRAVIEHEREHAQQRHGRLIAAAQAIAHGSFQLHPARHAAAVLDRELDTLADRAAARRLGDPMSVQHTLHILATAASADGEFDASTRARIRRVSPDRPCRPLIDAIVRLVTLALGTLLLASICLAIHAGTAWIGVLACAVLTTSFVHFTKPLTKTCRTARRRSNA